MAMPPFIKKKDNSLLYSGEGEFLFYLPEVYFGDVKKNPIAQVTGQYVTFMGICDWAIMNKNGSVGKINNFKFPTILMCKPDRIENVRSLSINGCKPRDYRILHFKNGDEIISDINTPQIIDNVEVLFSMMMITGDRMPYTVPYNKMHEYVVETMNLNGEDFGLNMQLFGIMVSEICRDSKDLTKPFRLGNPKSYTDYHKVSIKDIPKYISPYIAFTSENFDESLMASVILSDSEEHKDSPMERMLML